MLAALQSTFHKRIMGVVRRGDINHVDVGVGKNLVNSVVNFGDVVLFGEGDGFVVRAIGDGVKRPALLAESLSRLVCYDAHAEHRPIKIFIHNKSSLNQNVSEHGKNFLPVISAGNSPATV